MEFAYFILIYSLFFFDFGATNDANACMNREYTPYEESTISEKFRGEYSRFYGGIQKLLRKSEVVSKIEKDNIKQICGCAYSKLKQKDQPGHPKISTDDFNNMLQKITTEKVSMQFKISYFVCMIKHFFPAIICTLEGDKRIVIAKGCEKRSSEKQVYNVYVGAVTNYENVKIDILLEGVIDDVDVEMPAFGPSVGISPSV